MNMAQNIENTIAIDENIDDVREPGHNVLTLGSTTEKDVALATKKAAPKNNKSNHNNNIAAGEGVGMKLTKSVAELVSKLWQVQPLETMPSTSISKMVMLTEMAKQDRIKNYDSSYTGWTHYSSFNIANNWGFWTKDKAEKPEDKGYSGVYSEKIRGLEVENQTGRFNSILQPQLSPLGYVLESINSLPLNDNIRQTTASSPGTSDWQSMQWLGSQMNNLPENWIDEVPLIRLLLMAGTNISAINPFVEDRAAYKWNNLLGSKGEVTWAVSNGVYDAEKSVESVMASCVMFDTFVSIATGKAVIPNYGPSTWGSSTAVIPIKAVDAGRWMIPFTFAYLDTLTYNMMTQYAVCREGDNWEEVVANTLATTIRIRGPYSKVLFVMLDGTSKQPATNQWRWGGANEVVNINIWTPNVANNPVDIYPTFRRWLGVGVAPLPTVSNDIGIAWRHMNERCCMGEMAWNAVALASELMFKDWIIGHGCITKSNDAPLDQTAEYKVMRLAEETSRLREGLSNMDKIVNELKIAQAIEENDGIFEVFDDIFDFLERFRELLHDEHHGLFDSYVEQIEESINAYEVDEEYGSEKIAQLDVSEGLLSIIRLFSDKRNARNKYKIRNLVTSEYLRYQPAVFWCLQHIRRKKESVEDKGSVSSDNSRFAEFDLENNEEEEYGTGAYEYDIEEEQCQMGSEQWDDKKVNEYNGYDPIAQNIGKSDECSGKQAKGDQCDQGNGKKKGKKSKKKGKNTCGTKPVPHNTNEPLAKDDNFAEKINKPMGSSGSSKNQNYQGMRMDDLESNEESTRSNRIRSGKKSIIYRNDSRNERLRADPINLAWYDINSVNATLTAEFKNKGAAYIRGTQEAETYNKDIVTMFGKYFKGRYGLTKEKEKEWLPDMRACWVQNTIARTSPMKRNFGTVWTVKKPSNLLPYRSIAKEEKQNSSAIPMHRSQESSALWRIITHAGLVLVNNNYPRFKSGRAAFVFCKGVAMLMGASFENILHDCSLPAAKASGMCELINREEGMYDVCWVSTEGRVCNLRTAREGWLASGGKDSDGIAMTCQNYAGWKRIFTGTIPWWQRMSVIGKFGIVVPVPNPDDKYEVENNMNDVEYLGRKVKHAHQWAFESQLSESLNTNMLYPAAYWWFEDRRVKVLPALEMDLLVDHVMAQHNTKIHLPDYGKLMLPNSYPIILPRMLNALVDCNYHSIWIQAVPTPGGIGYTRTDWNWPDPLLDWLKWGAEGIAKVVPHLLAQDWAGAALAAGSHLAGSLVDWLSAKSNSRPAASSFSVPQRPTMAEKDSSGGVGGYINNDSEN